MNKKEFAKKYSGFIKLMAIEKEVDMGIAEDMLLQHVRNRKYTDEELKVINPYAEPNELRYNFDGMENLNYSEIEKDVEEIDKQAKELRKKKGLDF